MGWAPEGAHTPRLWAHSLEWWKNLSDATTGVRGPGLFPSAVFGRLLGHREFAPAVALTLLWIVFEVMSDTGFFTSSELMGSVFALSASVGMVSLGVTMLMISGEFDLSVSATFALAPAVMGWLMREQGWDILTGFAVGLLVVAVIGLLNGLITVYVGVPSFIVTLGMLFAVTTWNRIILGGFPVDLIKEKGTFKNILGGDLPGTAVAAPFIWMLAAGIVLAFVLRRTRFGNWTFASGSFGGGVARAMGVPVRRVKISNFVLTASLAGLAGVLQFADFGSSSVASGSDLNLLAIVAVVIGGTSLFGTKGTIIGSMLGAIILGSLKVGLIIIKVPSEFYLGLVGLLLVVAAALNAQVEVKRRGGQRSSIFG
ncbi:MAG: ABC transporter permease [Acidimicrobiia bacterium]